MEITDGGRELLLANTKVLKSSKSISDLDRYPKNGTFSSLCLCAAFFGLGLSMALPGPTLSHLQRTTGTTEAHVTSIFTGRGLGYMTGSLLSGNILDHLKETPVIAASLMAMSGITIALPWCGNLLLLIFLFLLQGLTMGCLTTGGNHLAVNTWGQAAAPYMQGMHLAMGIGSFAAPLLVEPFLPHQNHINETKIGQNETTHNMAVNHVQFSYLIVGLLLVKISLMFCCLDYYPNKGSSQEVLTYSPENFRIKVITLVFCFYFASVGIQNTYGALSTDFSKKYFNFPSDKATFVPALFWGSFAMFQLVSIIISRLVTVDTILLTSVNLSLISLVALATLGSAKHEAVLWIFTATLGMGLATIFPTGIVWTERYVKITAKTTSVFVLGAALGEMTMPLLVSSLMNLSPMWLMYILLIVCTMKAVVFYVLFFMAKRTGDRYYNPLITAEDMDELEEAIYDKSWLTEEGNKLKPIFIKEHNEKHD